MKLVTVIPLARGVFKETLTYWSVKEVALGSIVTVPVRNRLVNALVVSMEEVGEAKANIKKAPFTLKKIATVKTNVFLPEFVRAAKKTADYFATPVGNVLQSFVPKAILESQVVGLSPKAGLDRIGGPRLKIEKLAFQSENEDRLAAYKSMIREEFARKSSVFITFPGIEDVRNAAASFGKGIEEYTYVFHSMLPKKTMISLWQKALKEKHSVVILATASFLSIPREDLKTLVIEKENSRGYKTVGRPEIDMRTFAENYAEERGLKLIYGDSFLRTQTLYRYHERELLEFTSVKFRSLATAGGVIIDMKKYPGSSVSGIARRKNEPAHKTFSTLSNELKALVELNRREHGHLAILVGRRGIAGTTVCGDCGKIADCDECGAPLVLHEKKEGKNGKRFFLCHKCGHERVLMKDGEERCPSCGSWRLQALGIGIERVFEELSREFPETQMFRLDSDAASSDKITKKIISDFYNTQGSVILGTEMLLSRLTKPVEASAIVGIDSLLTIPDFRINEKIFSLILSLREKTLKSLILQTREPERELFEDALRGDLLSFYRREIAERKHFGYPPFTVLVKISWNTKKERAEKEMSAFMKKFVDYDVREYISRYGSPASSVRANILMKLPRDKWVDERLLAFLKLLPPKYEIAVDPESII